MAARVASSVYSSLGVTDSVSTVVVSEAESSIIIGAQVGVGAATHEDRGGADTAAAAREAALALPRVL